AAKKKLEDDAAAEKMKKKAKADSDAKKKKKSTTEAPTEHASRKDKAEAEKKEKERIEAEKRAAEEAEKKRLTDKSPSPGPSSSRSSPAFKKKGIPKALFIPDEIKSTLGDPSTMHSETEVHTKITARESSAERIMTSPMKQAPASASFTVSSAKRSESKERTDAFSFKAEANAELAIEAKKDDVKDKKTLPPKPADEKRRKSAIKAAEIDEARIKAEEEAAAAAKKKEQDEEAERKRKEAEEEERRLKESAAKKEVDDVEAKKKKKKDDVASKKKSEAEAEAKADAEAKRKAEEEASAKKAKQEEEERKKKEDEETRRAAEAAKKKAEEEAEAERKRKEAEDEERRLVESAKKKAEEYKREAEEAKKKSKDDDKKKKDADNAAAKKKLEEEDKAKADAEAKTRAEEEAAAKKKAQEEEEERKKKEAEDAAAKSKKDEKKEGEGEVPKKKKVVKKKSEKSESSLDEEAMKKKKEEEERLKKEAEEAEAQRKADEEEAARRAEEHARIIAEGLAKAEAEEREAEDKRRHGSLKIRKMSSEDGEERGRRSRRPKEGFVIPLDEQVTALRGESATFTCEAAKEEDKITWKINGKSATADARAQIVVDGPVHKLILKEVSPKDSGAEIEALIGEFNTTSSLAVEDTPVKIVEKLERKTVLKVGEAATLGVTLNHDAVNIRWFRDGDALAVDGRHEMKEDKDKCSLIISSVQFSDAGSYAVIADGAESYTNVEVHGAPQFAEDGKHSAQSVDATESLTIALVFDAFPEPSAEVWLNGRPIGAETKCTMEVIDNKVRFVKRGTSKKDSGEYTIKLNNQYGSATHTVVVKVRDVPETPADISIGEVTAESVIVSWAPPSDDGGAEITGYLVERKEANRRAFHKVAQVPASKSSCTVDDLENDTGYVVRVSAVNKFGTGEPRVSTEVSTGTPYSPPTVNQAPKIVEMRPRGCKLEWEEVKEDGGSAIYGYDVYVRENGGEPRKLNEEPIFIHSFTADGLSEETMCEFKIEAINHAGLRSNSNKYSDSITISKTLGKPTAKLDIPCITITGTDSVTVAWEHAEDEDVTAYTVAYKSESSVAWTDVEAVESPLDIDGLKEGVSYVFKVAAKNEAGVGEYSAESVPLRVQANIKPQITKALKDASIPRKSPMRLECHAMAEPAAEYVWYKDGQEVIPQDDNMEIITEGFMSALIVHRTSAVDEGEYTCEVINTIGKTTSSAKIEIAEVRAHFTSSFPELQEVDEGATVTLTCELSDPDASVRWFKDGRRIVIDEHVIVKKMGSERMLIVNDANADDSGHYKAETTDGRSKTEGELIVKMAEARIVIGPQDKTVTSFGEAVIFHCQTSRPCRVVKWFKNGTEIWPTTGKFYMSVDGCTATLEVKNVESPDEGEIHAEISDKEKSAAAKLTLIVPPTIELDKLSISGGEIIHHAGKDLDFVVKFEGHPAPEVKLFLNSEPIAHRSRIETYDDCVSVRVKEVKRTDSGDLKVTATNSAGTVSKDLHLSIIDVPNPPTGITIIETTSNSVKISWEAPDDPNGSPVTGYVIERKSTETNRWRTVGKARARATTFESDDLFSKEVYSFRVCALNDVGQGAPSEAVDVITEQSSDDESIISEVIPQLPIGLAPPEKPEVIVMEGKVTLNWIGVTDATEYTIERKGEREEVWLEVATTDIDCFTDRSIVESKRYAYRIIASTAMRTSRPSVPSEFVMVKVDDEVLASRKISDDKKDVAVDETRMDDGAKKRAEDEAKRRAEEERKKNDDIIKTKDLLKKTPERDVKDQEAAPSNGDATKTEKTEEPQVDEPEKKTKVKKKKEKSDSVASEVGPKEKEKKVEERKDESVPIKKDAKKSEEDTKKTDEAQKKIEEEKKKIEDDAKKPSDAAVKDKMEDESEKKTKKVVKKKKEKSESVASEAGPKEEEKIKIKVRMDDTEANDAKKTDEDVATKKKSEADAKKKVEDEKKKTEIEAKKKEEEKKAVEAAAKKKELESKKDEKKKESLEAKAESEEVTLQLGASGELKINLSGAPQKTDATWTKDGKPVEARFSSSITTTAAMLKLNSVTESDAGKYTCSIRSSDGQIASANVLVTVTDKPSAEAEISVVEVKEGEPVQLYANVAGLPPPECKWYKDGVEIKADKIHSMSIRAGQATLAMKKATSDMAGDYKLVSKNKHGECTVELKLKVKGAPSVPIGPLTHSETSSAVTLKWNAPESDGGSPILGYCVEKRDPKRSTWSFCQRTTDTEITISNLPEGSSFLFRVAAENSLGAGAPLDTTEPIALKKPKNAPTKAPGKPSASGTTKDSITVEWTEVTEEEEIEYIIEIKETKSKRWSQAGKGVKGTHFTATGLKEGVEYQFRVTASNEAGSGPVSDVSNAIKCEHKTEASPPKFTVTPSDTTGNEKAKVKMTVEFEGSPAPEV
ncbi:hypothetical protein PENTCL1PPCAC_1861, partial [Pristionchus entomophagus]